MGQNGQSIRNYESFKLICICKYYARDFNARANLKGNPKPGRHWNRFFFQLKLTAVEMTI